MIGAIAVNDGVSTDAVRVRSVKASDKAARGLLLLFGATGQSCAQGLLERFVGERGEIESVQLAEYLSAFVATRLKHAGFIRAVGSAG